MRPLPASGAQERAPIQMRPLPGQQVSSGNLAQQNWESDPLTAEQWHQIIATESSLGKSATPYALWVKPSMDGYRIFSGDLMPFEGDENVTIKDVQLNPWIAYAANNGTNVFSVNRSPDDSCWHVRYFMRTPPVPGDSRKPVAIFMFGLQDDRMNQFFEDVGNNPNVLDEIYTSSSFGQILGPEADRGRYKASKLQYVEGTLAELRDLDKGREIVSQMQRDPASSRTFNPPVGEVSIS